MPFTTNAARSVLQDIERFATRISNPIGVERVLALRGVNPVAKKSKSKPKFNIAKFNAAKKAGKSQAQARAAAFGTAAASPPKKKKRKARKAKSAPALHLGIPAAALEKKPMAKARKKRKSSGKKRKVVKRKKARATTTKRRRTTKRRKATRTKRVVTRQVRVPKAKTGEVRVVLTSPRRKSKKKSSGKKRKSSRKRNPNPTGTALALRSGNPSGQLGAFDGLFSNPLGPFSKTSLMSYGSAALGVGLGLVLADGFDRFVATRTPADSTPSAGTAKRPWFGKNAAAAMARRPDGMRLGVQAGGAVASMVLAYLTRRGRALPWFFGGAAVGFGSNLLLQLVTWYVAPAVLKSKPTEENLGNRLYPAQQEGIQDGIDAIFDDWNANPMLQGGQAETANIPAIVVGVSGVLPQGKAGSGSQSPSGQLAAASDVERARTEGFFLTGRLGKCGSCGGQPGGCWASCPDLGTECGPCAGPGTQRALSCRYRVEVGDDLYAMAAKANVSVVSIDDLNGGTPDTYWRVGATVLLPNAMCKYLYASTPNGGGTPVMPPPPYGGTPMVPVPVVPMSPPVAYGAPMMPSHPPSGPGPLIPSTMVQVAPPSVGSDSLRMLASPPIFNNDDDETTDGK